MENETLPLFIPSSLDYFSIHSTIVVFFTLFLVIGIPGNVVVLYVYSKCFNNIFGLFVKSLAILDLVNIIGLVPPYAILKFIPETSSPSLCKFVLQAQNFNTTVTGLVYLTIAFQRYRQICHPTGHQINESSAKKLIIGCIVLAILSGLPILFLVTNGYFRIRMDSENKTYSLKVPKCDFTDESKQQNSALAFTIWLFIFLTSAVTCLIVLYALIARHIQKHNSNVAGLSNENRSRMSSMARVFCVLTIFYMITIIPRIELAVYFKKMTSMPAMDLSQVQIIDMLAQLPYLNCIVNPFIYGLCSGTFRRKVVEIICRRTRQQSSVPTGQTTSA